jgi:hypothetical protein
VLYAAKSYWPGVSKNDLDARRLSSEDAPYIGALLFPDDALVLCLFEAAAATAVSQACHREGLPCDRVMQALWLPQVGARKRWTSLR